MEKNNVLLGSLLLAVSVVAGVLALRAPVVVTVEKPLIVDRVVERLGASPGSQFETPELTVNGVKKFIHHRTFNTASSTVCSVLSPDATSTLLYAVARISTATNTALVWDWGKSTNSYSTTTILGGDSLSVASGAKGTISAGLASTTYMLDGATVIAPNNYVNLKYGPSRLPANGVPVNNGFAGSCKVEFLEI